MRVACVDTTSLCGEVMYKGFYYISLIKAGLYSHLGLFIYYSRAKQKLHINAHKVLSHPAFLFILLGTCELLGEPPCWCQNTILGLLKCHLWDMRTNGVCSSNASNEVKIVCCQAVCYAGSCLDLLPWWLVSIEWLKKKLSISRRLKMSEKAADIQRKTPEDLQETWRTIAPDKLKEKKKKRKADCGSKYSRYCKH